MTARVNAGYTITDSIRVGETEFVLGEHGGRFPMYATWACKDGDNYYWGHYMADRLEAVADLMDRAGKELEFQMERQGKSSREPEKREKERER